MASYFVSIYEERRVSVAKTHPVLSSGLFNAVINASDYRSIASDSKMINI